jgi:hypothetical protein
MPQLTFPALALVGAVALTAVAIASRRGAAFCRSTFGACAAATLLAPAVMQARGIAVLELPHLLHIFFLPTFLVFGFVLGGGDGAKTARQPWALPAVCLAALALPLCVAGGWLSARLVETKSTLPGAHAGLPAAVVIVLVAVLAGVMLRRDARGPAVVGVVAFGLTNAAHTCPNQPAYVYAVGEWCSFRADAFSALMEADEAFEQFDPHNEARWSERQPKRREPAFDGTGWCNELPTGMVGRAILRTRYFYTTAQFQNGFKFPERPTKLALAGVDEKQLDDLARVFAASTHVTLVPVLSRVVSRPTVTVHLRGYDVIDDVDPTLPTILQPSK